MLIIGPVGSEDRKRTVERIGASTPYQRQQTVRPPAEVDRVARKKDFHARRYHADRTARMTRCKCASSISAPARTTTLPMRISTTGLAPVPELCLTSFAPIWPGSPASRSSRRHDTDPPRDRRDVHSRLASFFYRASLKLVRSETPQMSRGTLRRSGTRASSARRVERPNFAEESCHLALFLAHRSMHLI